MGLPMKMGPLPKEPITSPEFWVKWLREQCSMKAVRDSENLYIFKVLEQNAQG